MIDGDCQVMLQQNDELVSGRCYAIPMSVQQHMGIMKYLVLNGRKEDWGYLYEPKFHEMIKNSYSSIHQLTNTIFIRMKSELHQKRLLFNNIYIPFFICISFKILFTVRTYTAYGK